MDDIDKLKQKYLGQISTGISGTNKEDDIRVSRDYENFRSELIPVHANWYEKWCNFFENIIRLNPPPKVKIQLEEQITVAHLNVTAEGVYSFSFMLPIFLILISVLGFVVIPVLFGLAISTFF